MSHTDRTTSAIAPPLDPDKPMSSPTSSRWGWLATLFKILFSGLAIAFVFSTVDVAAAWRRSVNQDLWLVAVAAALIVVQIQIGGLRWHVVLRTLGAQVRVRDSLQLFYAGVFFNAYLWGALAGSAARVWLLTRIGERLRVAFNSVVLDQVAALAGIAILVLVTAPLFISRVGLSLPALLPAAICAGGLVGIVIVSQLDRLPLTWQRFWVLRQFSELGSATRAVFLRPAALIPALALAATAQLTMALYTYVLSQSLQIEVSLLDCIVLMQPVALIVALPISIGGWGVRETAIIGLFSLVGVPANAALALSVQLGLLTILVSLPGGIVWLFLRAKKPVQQAAA